MNNFKQILIMTLAEDYSEAHKVAQRNAALPIEKGGLGLHPENTAMDRAKAMGYHTKAYHGTSSDFDNFDIEKSMSYSNHGKGVYVTYNPNEEWAKSKDGERIIPLLVNRDSVLKNEPPTKETHEKISKFLGRKVDVGIPYMSLEKRGDGHLSIGAQLAGFSGVDHASTYPSSTNYNTVFTDLSKVRSIHAAFDPMRKHESELLA